jgi:predicted outer membrane repeat protein
VENDMKITKSHFKECATDSRGWGGALHVKSSIVSLDETSFLKSNAGQGGAMDCLASTITGKNITMNHNVALTNNGGGLHTLFCKILFSQMQIHSNTALKGNGGGIYFGYQSKIEKLKYSLFSSNSALGGAGIYLDRVSTLNAKNSTFTSNTATNGGGGIASYESRKVEMTYLEFITNVAQGIGGGGLYFDMNQMDMKPNLLKPTWFYDGRPKLTDLSFVENTALKGGGGGIYWKAGPSTMGNLPCKNPTQENANNECVWDDRLPLVEFTFPAGSKQRHHNEKDQLIDASLIKYDGNTALYGGYVASGVTTLAIKNGPLHTDDRKFTLKAGQSNTWKEKIKWITDSNAMSEKGGLNFESSESRAGPWTIETLDYYNRLVKTSGEYVRIHAETLLPVSECNSIKGISKTLENVLNSTEILASFTPATCTDPDAGSHCNAQNADSHT